jgi:hypothetical protein
VVVESYCRRCVCVEGAGTVYVGCDNHQLYAVSPLSGLIVLSIPTGGAVQSSPAIGFSHALAVGSSDGRVYFVEG